MLLGFCFSLGESNFREIRLPFDSRIEIPKNWVFVSEGDNETIETIAEAAMKNMGVEPSKSINIFRSQANVKGSYATASVTIGFNDRDTYSELKNLSLSNSSSLKHELKSIAESMLNQSGQKLLDFNLNEIKKSDKKNTISYSYIRTGPVDDVVVSMDSSYFPRKKYYYIVRVSYRKSDKSFWLPITTYIKNSFQ